MTRDQALQAADCAAKGVIFALSDDAASPSQWSRFMARPLEQIAPFIAAHPDAPADAIYIYGQGARNWTALDAYERVAVEVFGATYLTVLRLVLAEEAAVAEMARSQVQPAPSDPLFRRLERIDDITTRLDFCSVPVHVVGDPAPKVAPVKSRKKQD